jgi:hypothetical protein
MNIIELENKVIYRGSNYKTAESKFLKMVSQGKPVALITTKKGKVIK